VILVDTSVWVDHLRRGNAPLRAHLENGEVACHPFVVGELACGALHRRHELLHLLDRLPSLPIVDHHEVLGFVEKRRLTGRGLGWIDVHLLAATVLAGGRMLTFDRRLAASAAALGVA
jgi:predicted nucleic acid-binding protein